MQRNFKYSFQITKDITKDIRETSELESAGGGDKISTLLGLFIIWKSHTAGVSDEENVAIFVISYLTK